MKQEIEQLIKRQTDVEAKVKMRMSSSSGNLALIRKVIVASVKHLNLAKETIEGLKLAVTEACTNVIRHAHKYDDSKSFDIEIRGCEKAFIIEILYNDPGFDPSKIPVRDLSEVREGGYGVFLMHSIMDYVNYITDSKTGDVRLQMVKLAAEIKNAECVGGSCEN